MERRYSAYINRPEESRVIKISLSTERNQADETFGICRALTLTNDCRSGPSNFCSGFNQNDCGISLRRGAGGLKSDGNALSPDHIASVERMGALNFRVNLKERSWKVRVMQEIDTK